MNMSTTKIKYIPQTISIYIIITPPILNPLIINYVYKYTTLHHILLIHILKNKRYMLIIVI